MGYSSIHHWQYEPGEEENRILEAAIALSSKSRGQSFLLEAAAFIAEHTRAKYVSIGVLTEDKRHIRTRALLREKQTLDNVTYPLQGTPCQDVQAQDFCYFPFSVTKKFPLDRELQQLGVESYLGSLLLSQSNEALGVVALMDTKPIERPAFAEHLILVLGPAVEVELERSLRQG